jgi:hypothetical protein
LLDCLSMIGCGDGVSPVGNRQPAVYGYPFVASAGLAYDQR